LPDALLSRTIEAVGLLAAGHTVAAGLLSTKASALTDAVLHAMAAAKWKMAGVLVLLVGLAMGVGIVICQTFASQPSSAEADPAQDRARSPVTVTVIVAYPGAAPEEVERQVAVPLEVGLAGVPRLESVRSKSLFGVCWLYASFQPPTAYEDARREVINCLARINKLPPNVAPRVVPGPGGDSSGSVATAPKDARGKPQYALHDLRNLQDWVLEREFRTVPGVADVVGSGGVVKRYEIHPDPDRLRRYGITLRQLADAIVKGNGNTDGAGQLTPRLLNAGTPAKAAQLPRPAARRPAPEITEE